MSYRLKDNLIGYWPLNNNTIDRSGYENNGTWVISEGYEKNQFGKSAGNFNASRYINIGEGAGLYDFGLNPFTLSLWFKPGLLAAERFIFTKRNGGGTTAGFSIYFDSLSQIRGLLADGINLDQTSSIAACCLGISYHVVSVYNNDNIYLYINGDLIDVVTRTAGIPDNDDNLYIGVRGDTNNPFTGDIWNVRIFNCALTGSEQKKLFWLEHRI